MKYPIVVGAVAAILAFTFPASAQMTGPANGTAQSGAIAHDSAMAGGSMPASDSMKKPMKEKSSTAVSGGMAGPAKTDAMGSGAASGDSMSKGQ